jgi:hypothetical protein
MLKLNKNIFAMITIPVNITVQINQHKNISLNHPIHLILINHSKLKNKLLMTPPPKNMINKISKTHHHPLIITKIPTKNLKIKG